MNQFSRKLRNFILIFILLGFFAGINFLFPSCKSLTADTKQSKERTGAGDVLRPESTGKEENDRSETTSRKLDEIIKKLGEKKTPQLSLKEVVEIVVYNSNAIKLQKLEIIKSDTDIKKEESKYAPVLDFKYQNYERIDKLLPQATFTGTKINQEVFSLGIQKLFETGTFLRVEGSDTKFDTNAGETPLAATNPILQQLRQPPIHTAAIRILFQQDLLKNGFGYSQKRLEEIARKKSLIQREQLEFQLAGLIAKTIIDYWSLAIAEIELKTATGLLENVNTIRNITYMKRNLGLAEAFEVAQWEALYNQAEIAVNVAKLERDNRRKELLRVLNLDPGIALTGLTELQKDLPQDINLEKDIEYALKNRKDLKIIRQSLEIARLTKELARNNLQPTVRVGGQYATRDFGRYPGSAWDNVHSGKYPERAVEFSIQYPLWDEGAKVDLRNAEITVKQLEIQEKDTERAIRDEVETGYNQILTAYDSLKKAEQAYRQTLNFYNGLLNGYRKGRFNATAIKNALDALLQAEKGYNQALINYNIILVRYDLIRNMLFEKFNINTEEILSVAR